MLTEWYQRIDEIFLACNYEKIVVGGEKHDR